MESTDSSAGGGSQHPNLPPGFRFHPTDEELVVHYLKKKSASAALPISIIAEVDLYKFDPWELPAKALFGEQEWYFFSPRDRKYPNGARPNRAATSGYWKATGTDKPVLTSGGTQKVGVKKALVFYGGKPPKGIKTNWIMHEYRLADNKNNNKPPSCVLGNKKNSLRLDDWVLCRIYKKNNSQRPMDHDKDDSTDDMLGPIMPSMSDSSQDQIARLQLGQGGSFGSMLTSEQILFDGVHRTNTMSQLASSDSKPDHLPMFPLKRGLPSLYWPDEELVTSSSASKRFHGGDNKDGNGSIATILSQLPHTPSMLHQQQMAGSLGDGMYVRPPYQFPGLNWYN